MIGAQCLMFAKTMKIIMNTRWRPVGYRGCLTIFCLILTIATCCLVYASLRSQKLVRADRGNTFEITIYQPAFDDRFEYYDKIKVTTADGKTAKFDLKKHDVLTSSSELLLTYSDLSQCYSLRKNASAEYPVLEIDQLSKHPRLMVSSISSDEVIILYGSFD